MARKPNYGFERRERERLKAEKKAARLEAKRARAAAKRAGTEDGDDPDSGAELDDAPSEVVEAQPEDETT